MQHYLFSQIDSWFFRESRSMDGSGAMGIESIFPPPNQTLLGALRSQIGECYFDKHGGNWQSFKDNSDLQKIIGYGQENYGTLLAQGAWLYHSDNKQLYFPAPANLVQRGDSTDEKPSYNVFKFGEPIQTDLGIIRLSELGDAESKQKSENTENECDKAGNKRDKAIEQYWISADAYAELLNGKIPQESDNKDSKASPKLVAQKTLLTDDIRLGIARDNQTRRTQDGMLYQTKHQRLKKGWHLYLGLGGIPDEYTNFCQKADAVASESKKEATRKDANRPILLRLGGEARMASLTTAITEPVLPCEPTANGCDLMLYLLTPLRDRRENSTTPPLPAAGFTRVEKSNSKGQKYHVWRGQLKGISVDIISAIIGKVQRIGGWDIVRHCSTPVRSCLPAGSCWYIECANQEDAQKLIKTLHFKYLSNDNDTDRAQGYGQVAVGCLPQESNN